MSAGTALAAAGGRISLQPPTRRPLILRSLHFPDRVGIVANELTWRAATRPVAGRYAAGPLRGLFSGPLRGP